MYEHNKDLIDSLLKSDSYKILYQNWNELAIIYNKLNKIDRSKA